MHHKISLLALVIALVFLSGCAGLSQPGPESAKETVSNAELPHRYCLRETGSRIRLQEGRCLTGIHGRVYYLNDIERTGAVTLGGALRALDSSFR